MRIRNALHIGGILCLGGLLAALLSTKHFDVKAVAQWNDSDCRPTILTTTFPAYDFARQLVGNWVDVQLLLPPGMESHTYEPTPQDILKIQNSKLFIYTGGESEHWLMGLLASLGLDTPRTMAMMDCVLMQKEYAPSIGEKHSQHYGKLHNEVELDEHVWTSPKNVKSIIEKLEKVIRDSLSLPDEALKEIADNAAAYICALDKLDISFQTVVAEGRRDKIVFGDRFPFQHLAVDYGLRYSAAFPNCSEDSEPSAQTIILLIQEIRNEKIPVVFYIEFSNRQIVKIFAEETGAIPILLHSCHNVTRAEMEAGVTYLSLMEQNVNALREALN